MSSELDILEPILMADEIQGNVLGGFNKDHQAILPLRFGDTPTAVAAVRSWLASILPAITWLREVVDYKRVRRRRIAAESREPDMPALWRNIAFSYPGLRKLTEQADAFDPIFRDGLPAASFRLGDPGQEGVDGNVSTWLVGKPGEIPDLLFIIAGDDPAQLEGEVETFLRRAKDAGLDCPFYDIGHDLSYYSTETVQFPKGREHFGFKDGVSQPGIRGRMSVTPGDFLTPRTRPDIGDPGSALPQFSAPGQPLVCVGEFVLGYRRQSDSFARRTAAPWKLGPEPFTPDPTAVAPYWARNGSFLVYRRLRQDVPGFNRFLLEEAVRLAQTTEFSGLTAEMLGAMLVGRWCSGAPFLRSQAGDSPLLGSSDGPNNAFGFMPAQDPADGFPVPVPDPLGLVCPQASHIRKVNPRDLPTDQGSPNTTLVHRILRRGIPYGPPLPFGATKEPEKQNRGLLFISYQSSIREQFEFLASSWMNDRSKPTAQFSPPGGSGFDMIVGQNPNTSEDRDRFCLVGRSNARVSTTGQLQRQWVIPAGGGYFFAPSQSAVRDVLAQSQ